MHHKDLIKTPSLKHTINDKNQIEERVGKYLIFSTLSPCSTTIRQGKQPF